MGKHQKGPISANVGHFLNRLESSNNLGLSRFLYPLEAERNMMPSELSTLNARVTEFETYYGNLELTAQAIQMKL